MIHTVQAAVTSVSDGDTVHVNLNGRDERVRMIGVNCSEISHPDLGIKEEPYGREAKAYTEKQLTGKKVWLEFDVQERDNCGRLLNLKQASRRQAILRRISKNSSRKG